MKVRLLFSICVLIVIFCSLGGIFWYQEKQYLLPTTVPSNYKNKHVGQEVIHAKFDAIKAEDKPVVLHFFNPDCPCARFNMDHFSDLVEAYKDKCTFYAVLQVEESENAISKFREKYNLDIPVIIDVNKELAEAYGVYSTPQAVIVKNNKLYYRGNYNKSRYCTSKNSNFAQMALDSLLAEKPAPEFMEAATKAYGCQLPDSTSNLSQSIITIFNQY